MLQPRERQAPPLHCRAGQSRAPLQRGQPRGRPIDVGTEPAEDEGRRQEIVASADDNWSKPAPLRTSMLPCNTRKDPSFPPAPPLPPRRGSRPLLRAAGLTPPTRGSAGRGGSDAVCKRPSRRSSVLYGPLLRGVRLKIAPLHTET